GTPTSDSFNWTSAFTVGTLGVDSFTLNNTITVFPNPIVDNKVRFNLSTNDFIDGEVILYDLAGRVIVSKKINQNTGELNVVGVSEGFYFMKFINEDKIATKKLIIK
ncbi:MAG: T9SS type A sorting domain-containing protein, partial [Bacteroidetes bacterium]|nr:T9SS type A sorting domain-containing protein [Bacteroidota bacterium]